MKRFRRRWEEPSSPLAELIPYQRDTMDSGQLVRALARSWVHVPMPDEPPVDGVKVDSAAEAGGPPLYTVTDDAGEHALLYTTRERLCQVWGDGATAAMVQFPTLLLGWPDGVDLVIDAGLPEALEVGADLLRHTALEIGGVPTGTSLQPSPAGMDARLPQPEPVQVLGVTREVAESIPGVLALWRAELLPREPQPRPVLTLVVELEPQLDQAEFAAAMSVLSKAIEQVEPMPVMLLPVQQGERSEHQDLIDEVRDLDSPYWRRDT